jgi:hypothetical protein
VVETQAPDVARLQAQHPDWLIGSMWAGAATGPDRRLLTAQRRGVLLAAHTPALLSEKIRKEGQC